MPDLATLHLPIHPVWVAALVIALLAYDAALIGAAVWLVRRWRSSRPGRPCLAERRLSGSLWNT